ncbi:hypothetical protein M0R04_15380 [Candidatus Dojkabacteria bacterium]|jgi:hypothetical protein|nr:hypothetical protein [Candidatus Dojkabacteria bacterium]
MQIKNPLNEKIEGVKINETIYNIEANGTLDNVPEADARYWQENLHKFLILRKDKLEEVVSKETIEIPTPKVEEVIEETVVVDIPEEETIIEGESEIKEDGEVVSEVIKVVKVKGKKK